MNDSVDTDTGLHKFLLTMDPVHESQVAGFLRRVANDPGRTGPRD